MSRRAGGSSRAQLERAGRIDVLATELSRVRQRGVDYLELASGRQHRVLTPLLDELAHVARGRRGLDRVGAVRRYLDESLAGYAEVRAEEAATIRRLFFDTSGRSPGPGRPAGLLRQVRKASGLTEESFRKLQREHFVDFARYLTAESRQRRRRVWPSMMVAATVAVGLAVTVALVAALLL